MAVSRAAELFSKLTPIPEVGRSEVPVRIDVFAALRGHATKSPEPFIVRDGKKRLAGTMMTRYRDQVVLGNPVPVHVREDQYGYSPAFETVHADAGPYNDATAHITLLGVARVVLFPRSSSLPDMSFRWTSDQTDELLQTGHCQGLYLRDASFARLLRNDVLFFDHTKPHLFDSELPGRQSSALYLEEGAAD